jgi:hypothetical protein
MVRILVGIVSNDTQHSKHTLHVCSSKQLVKCQGAVGLLLRAGKGAGTDLVVMHGARGGGGSQCFNRTVGVCCGSVRVRSALQKPCGLCSTEHACSRPQQQSLSPHHYHWHLPSPFNRDTSHFDAFLSFTHDCDPRPCCLCREFGPIFSWKLGPNKVIAVLDYDLTMQPGSVLVRKKKSI